jgi:hypothetical protein
LRNFNSPIIQGMTRMVTSDFMIDGPDFAYAGLGKFTIPEGARLDDVTGPDRYGYIVFKYGDQQLKAQIAVVQEHSEVAAGS